MAKGYTTKAKIENFLLVNIDASFDAQVTAWIEDIERLIDELTGRNFKADSTAGERLFNGDGSNELEIDDCVEITKVEVGQDEYGSSYDEISSGDYIKLPANAIAKNQPIKAIHLKSGYFTEGLQNHRITAKWGYSAAVPGDITMVATLIVAHIYKFGRGGVKGGVASERIGNYAVTYQDKTDKDQLDEAMMVLDKYKRYYL